MKSTSRAHYLDLLKAVSIFLVMFWHLQPIRLIYLSDRSFTIWDEIPRQLLDILNYQVTLIAVPTFILVSMFLFIQKSSGEKQYFLHRFKRLLILYGFWTMIQTLIYLLILAWPNHESKLGKMPEFSLTQLFLEGGPGLPVGGTSVFYFLFVLLNLVAIASIYFALMRHRKRISDRGLEIISLVLIALFLIYFEITTLLKSPLDYWRIDNFIVYILIAYLLYRYLDRVRNAHLFVLGCLFVLFSIHDIYLRTMNFPPAVYSRISITIGAVLFFCLAYRIRFYSKSVEWIATYSLGIFALHKYFYIIFIVLFAELVSVLKLQSWMLIPGLNVYIDFYPLVAGIVTIALTMFTAWGLGKTKLRQFLV